MYKTLILDSYLAEKFTKQKYAVFQVSRYSGMEECKYASMQEGHYTTMQICKGVVSSYKIGLILPSVAETHPKIYPSRCNLEFSIIRHARGKVLSLANHHSL